ncbi:MAG: NifU N-terminal domain-containing protein [Gemmatimonadetes bacterium]|nr:NifU N-terminal domain-containing protein [Gemmatimonadota bacterium]
MSELTVQFQPTPNPNAGKFVLDRPSLQGADRKSVMNRAEAAGDPLAERLLAIEGVASLFFADNFITVIKTPSADWASLIPDVAQAIRAAYG